MATLARHPHPPLRPTIAGLVPGDLVPGRTANVTIADFIVEQVRAGVDVANAAGTVGVTPAEVMSWIREGTLVFQRLQAGADWTIDFTPDQQDAAWFADRVIRARSRHISTLSVIAENAARGTLPDKVTTRRKTVNGSVVEEHVTSEKVMPDLDMLKWKLEKLEPAVYGPKATLNVTVTDLTDTDAVGDVVEARMRQVAAALAIEATASA